jgi:hypothetical protein
VSEYESSWRLNSAFEKDDEARRRKQNEQLTHLSSTLDNMLGDWRAQRNDRRISREQIEKSQDMSPDKLRRDIDNLETGLGELRIWDVMLKEVIGSSDLCPSSPLATLLDRVRGAYGGYFSSLDSLFVEVRKRMLWEWKDKDRDTDKAEKDKIVRSKIQALQDELDEEVKQSNKLESNLEDLKASLTLTRDSTFLTIEEDRFRPDKQYNQAENRVEPVSKETLEREDDLHGDAERSGEESSGSDDDDDDDSKTEEEEDDDSDDPDLIRAIRKRKQQRATKRANKALTLSNHLKIHSIKNGERVSGDVVNNSHYYQFALDKDDIAVMVQIEQRPAGDKDNYLELTLNRGSPPTRIMRDNGTSTQNEAVALLNLQAVNLGPGQWFMRVIGRGSRPKAYMFEFRVASRLMDFSRTLTDTIDDLETQISWQGDVTEEMVNFGELVTHTHDIVAKAELRLSNLSVAQADYKEMHNTQERAMQATDPPATSPQLEDADNQVEGEQSQELDNIPQSGKPDECIQLLY